MVSLETNPKDLERFRNEDQLQKKNISQHSKEWDRKELRMHVVSGRTQRRIAALGGV